MSAVKGKTDIRLNRRDFLKVVSAGAAAGIVVPVLPAWARKDARKKWRMRLSTSSIHFMQLPIEQACEQIAKLDFEAIDIWSAHEGCPHLDDVAKRLGADGLKKLLVKSSLNRLNRGSSLLRLCTKS